ncbi:hypothetical protein K8I31_15075 [bacterium]|nr:hypothetical protein [bacterium]
MSDQPIVFCELNATRRKAVQAYAEALREAAPLIGDHGMTIQEFWESGVFNSAIESLRGTNAASMMNKREFVEVVFNRLQEVGEIQSWASTGAGERFDYEVIMPDGWRSVVETKGCLDGNNTNIFERPPQADEFIIWSLCQNPGADPRRNVNSGIHTRLGAEIIKNKQRVDGLIVWDMVCGTAGRPCPKLSGDAPRVALTFKDRNAPPPCFYLFPRSVPDPRNNPEPQSWRLSEVRLIAAMHRAFQCDENDVVSVRIEARMNEADIQRRTCLTRSGNEFMVSKWTTLKRAR